MLPKNSKFLLNWQNFAKSGHHSGQVGMDTSEQSIFSRILKRCTHLPTYAYLPIVSIKSHSRWHKFSNGLRDKEKEKEQLRGSETVWPDVGIKVAQFFTN